jgi:hypothetical protein
MKKRRYNRKRGYTARRKRHYKRNSPSWTKESILKEIKNLETRSSKKPPHIQARIGWLKDKMAQAKNPKGRTKRSGSAKRGRR